MEIKELFKRKGVTINVDIPGGYVQIDKIDSHFFNVISSSYSKGNMKDFNFDNIDDAIDKFEELIARKKKK